MENLLQDIRYGLKILFRYPGFALAVILSLSLAIGANSAIFSIVNAVLLRALPFNEPERLTKIWDSSPLQTGERNSVSYPNFTDWRQQAQSFEDMAAVYPAYLNLVEGSTPERIRADWVSESYFRVLGVRPASGRTFLPDEDTMPDKHPVAVLSYNLWQRRFNSDPSLVNGTLRLNDNNYTVVGIAPEGFGGLDGDTEVWLPMMMISAVRTPSVLQDRAASWHEVIARLKPGATLGQAQTEIGTITARLEQAYPETNRNKGGLVISLHEEKFGKLQRPLIILLGSVGFVLLIACANVANLLLARAMGRRREISLRMALGADRKRLIRQLLTESMLLALMSGALGLVLTYWMLNSLVGLIPVEIPKFVKIDIDKTVLVFNLVISIFTGLVFGLMPALQSSKTNLNEMLKEAGRGAISGGGAKARSVLVVLEVALAVVLLIGAGLLIKSFQRLLAIDPGFNPDGLLTMRVSLPTKNYAPAQAAIFSQRLIDGMEGRPSVESIALSSDIPLGEVISSMSVNIEGRQPNSPGSETRVNRHRVSPKFFTTMGIPLLKGRYFTQQDNDQAEKVVIISENMAKSIWPDEDPIGKRIKSLREGSPWLSVVGVVENVKYRGLPENPDNDPDVYLPLLQEPVLSMYAAIRSKVNPSAAISDFRTQIQSLDPELPVFSIVPMEKRVADKISQPRFNAFLMTILAFIALILAILGVYGIISYSVSQRSQEIGIRMALGAQKSDILKMVITQGMRLVTIGLLIGLAVAFYLNQILLSLLHNVSAADPIIYATISALLVGAGFTACLLPALRAMQVDPMTALYR